MKALQIAILFILLSGLTIDASAQRKKDYNSEERVVEVIDDASDEGHILRAGQKIRFQLYDTQYDYKGKVNAILQDALVIDHDTILLKDLAMLGFKSQHSSFNRFALTYVILSGGLMGAVAAGAIEVPGLIILPLGIAGAAGVVYLATRPFIKLNKYYFDEHIKAEITTLKAIFGKLGHH